MSASAFVVNQNSAILLSDGYAYLNGKVVEEDARKAWRLKENVGLVWMGTRFEPLDGLIMNVTGLSAEEAIHNITGKIETAVNASPHWKDRLSTDPFNLFTFEWRGGELHYWRNFYHEDNFTPIYKGKLAPGHSGFLICEPANPAEARDLFLKFTQFNMQQNDFETSAREAFSEVIKFYNRNGAQVGGEIFTVVITA